MPTRNGSSRCGPYDAGRGERSFLNAEEFVGRLLDVEDDAVAMELFGVRQRFEDEEIECPCRSFLATLNP